MPSGRAAALTEQFYEWERRGRGWEVWEAPVDLEPGFAPFRYHYVPRQSATTDDGRRPTRLSRLADRVIERFRSAPPGPSHGDLPALELEAPPPEPGGPAGPLAELRVALPKEQDVALEVVEQFLVTLPRLSRPASFEVIGTSEAVWVQATCAASEQPLLEQSLKAHFSGAVVTAFERQLERAWSADPRGRGVVVDFGLADEFMLPLRMLRRLNPDPLTGVAAALGELEPGEVGVLQVLWAPVRNRWSESIMRAVLDERGSPFFLDAPEVSKLAREKVARPLFASVIRVAARSPSPPRAMLIARSIGWALSTLANPPANRLIPLDNHDYPDDVHEQDLLDRQTHRSGMILSSAELVSLVHPPSSSVRIEKLVREVGKTRPAPAIVTGHEYVLGTNAHAGRTTEVSLSEDQRSRHMYVVGASGTGKSTMLLNMILQGLSRGEGMAVLDPHGDLVDELVRRLPPERLADVVLLDPADGEFPIGFNILSAHSELERTLLSSDLVSVFRRLSTSWGDQMTSVLGNAILAFLESDRGGTLVDLRRFLVEAEFRREFLKSVQDPEVVYYWQKEFPLLTGKPQAPLLTRLDIFLRPKTIRYMVAQQDSKLDLRRLMDEGKVLLARLSQGAIGEENAHLLGTLLVSKLHQHAMSRQDTSAADRRPFYLYIDEFHHFVTPSMESILSGARKYRLALVLAHQDLRQLQSRSSDVLAAVIANPCTRICFRVGDEDARVLAKGFSSFGAEDLQSLSTGEAIARVERADCDFNLRTPRLPPVSPEVADARREQVISATRAAYGRPRREIEAMLRPADRVDTPSVERQAVAVVIPTDPTPHSPPARPDEPPATARVDRPAAGIPTDVSAGGRGGRQHTYLQDMIRRWADANDWRATLEEEVLDGVGRVDVALRRAELSVACEIVVTSPAEHEFRNIQKCLTAGFSWVVSISDDARRLGQIRALAKQHLGPAELERVCFVKPAELFDWLAGLGERSPQPGTAVRGYRVRVRMRPGDSDEQQAKHGAVSAVIAKALRRLTKRT